MRCELEPQIYFKVTTFRPEFRILPSTPVPSSRSLLFRFYNQNSARISHPMRGTHSAHLILCVEPTVPISSSVI
jgi:hypothetical protein